MRTPQGTPEIAKLLWTFIDSWNVGVGRNWLGGDHNINSKHPKMSKVTVIFQVPPLRAAPANQFLRESAKAAKVAPGNEFGLPSDLDLVNIAVENAELRGALEDIRSRCELSAAVTCEETSISAIHTLACTALALQGTGAVILTAMQQMREAVLEKSVEVAAELLKALDD